MAFAGAGESTDAPLHHRDDQSTSAVICVTAITLRSHNRDGSRSHSETNASHRRKHMFSPSGSAHDADRNWNCCGRCNRLILHPADRNRGLTAVPSAVTSPPRRPLHRRRVRVLQTFSQCRQGPPRHARSRCFEKSPSRHIRHGAPRANALIANFG